ncbi:hypothetical protein [Roseibium sp. RKSG952]|uniref:hypothetical protein n=1 Tax=Roseibium sp. RKSG952 TaxID=2529384 RepID=UPI0012BB7C9D|nr:hypothetical protein [Roseibium sp. RKSG952]MTI00022.1 hypothetical protein [Roseibium sp. RKSG952]
MSERQSERKSTPGKMKSASRKPAMKSRGFLSNPSGTTQVSPAQEAGPKAHHKSRGSRMPTANADGQPAKLAPEHHPKPFRLVEPK